LKELGIVAALAIELRPLGPTVSRTHTVATLGDGSLIIASGMGRAAAAAGARRLVEAGAGALISWGLAGGLEPALAAGTIVLPSEVVSPEGAVFATTSAWREQLRSAIAASQAVCGGRLLTCRQLVASPADKASVWRRMTAAAVDMESLAIAEVAAEHGLPFLAVRAVVDTAADTLPPALIAAAAGAPGWGIGRLLGALARAPGELPDFLRLWRRHQAASRALAMVARSGALAPPCLGHYGCARRA
jgi:adenosylhomocysteine nucleosidase